MSRLHADERIVFDGLMELGLVDEIMHDGHELAQQLYRHFVLNGWTLIAYTEPCAVCGENPRQVGSNTDMCGICRKRLNTL